jgi:hypothetical protein
MTIPTDMLAHNRKVIEDFRANGGPNPAGRCCSRQRGPDRGTALRP